MELVEVVEDLWRIDRQNQHYDKLLNQSCLVASLSLQAKELDQF